MYEIRMWNRLKRKFRQRGVRLACLVMLTLGVMVTFAVRKNTRLETDARLEIFTGALHIPAGSKVLPDSVTVIHNVDNDCSNGNGSRVFVIFMVITAPENKLARTRMRQAFKSPLIEYNKEFSLGNYGKVNELLFFSGQPSSELDQRKLLHEAKFHDDLIIEDLSESYYNLSLKSLRVLKWVEQNCYHADFTVKMDDDVFVNMRRLIGILETMSKNSAGQDFVGGDLQTDNTPIRDPSSINAKWYTPYDLWPEETLPDFVSGPLYVLGQEARSKVYQKALTLPFFHLEDVFLTGIVARKELGLKVSDMPVISHWWIPLWGVVTSSCYFQKYYTYAHFFTERFNYMECWKKFNDKEFSCSRWPLATHCWFE